MVHICCSLDVVPASLIISHQYLMWCTSERGGRKWFLLMIVLQTSLAYLAIMCSVFSSRVLHSWQTAVNDPIIGWQPSLYSITHIFCPPWPSKFDPISYQDSCYGTGCRMPNCRYIFSARWNAKRCSLQHSSVVPAEFAPSGKRTAGLLSLCPCTGSLGSICLMPVPQPRSDSSAKPICSTPVQCPSFLQQFGARPFNRRSFQKPVCSPWDLLGLTLSKKKTSIEIFHGWD